MLIDDLAQLPDTFKEGYRGVLLLLRSKDGQHGNADRKALKQITRNTDEWTHVVNEFKRMRKYPEYEHHRIYSSINARDIGRAIREFKVRQLSADYDDGELVFDFYTDIKNRFFSCLMNPISKMTSYFLIDCDSLDEYNHAMASLQDAALIDKIIFEYKTRNGFHIITQPFNPQNVKGVQIKKDELISIA